MTGQTDQRAAVPARLAGLPLSFPRLAEVGGDHERGDLAYGTRVGWGGGGDRATLRTGPFACMKAKPHKNRPRGNRLEMNTPRPAREVARSWSCWAISAKGWQESRREKVGIVLTVASNEQLKRPVNATWSSGSCPKNTSELKSGAVSIALITW